MKYTTPELEVLEFNLADVITVSAGGAETPDEEKVPSLDEDDLGWEA